MKIYVVYILADYEQAVYIATDEKTANKALKKLQSHPWNKNKPCYIKKYDLSKHKLIELDTD